MACFPNLDATRLMHVIPGCFQDLSRWQTSSIPGEGNIHTLQLEWNGLIPSPCEAKVSTFQVVLCILAVSFVRYVVSVHVRLSPHHHQHTLPYPEIRQTTLLQVFGMICRHFTRYFMPVTDTFSYGIRPRQHLTLDLVY